MAAGPGFARPAGRASRVRISGTVSGRRSAWRSTVSCPPDGRRSDDGEEGQGQHGERDVSVPGGPGADLVLVQSNLTLGRLEAGLDGPSCSRDVHQRADG